MPAKVISIANMKGGVGKTTLTVSLADGLAHTRGLKVLVIDIDPQTNSSQVLWGIHHETIPWVGSDHIAALLNVMRLGNPDIQSYLKMNIITRGANGRISLLSSSPELRSTERALLSEFASIERSEAYFQNAINRILDSLSGRFDVVIFDCPPGISLLTEAALYKSDLIMVPVAPSRLAAEGINEFSRFLTALDLHDRMKYFLSRMTNFAIAQQFRKEVFPKLINEYRELTAFANAMDYNPHEPMGAKYGIALEEVISLSHEVAEHLGLENR